MIPRNQFIKTRIMFRAFVFNLYHTHSHTHTQHADTLARLAIHSTRAHSSQHTCSRTYAAAAAHVCDLCADASREYALCKLCTLTHIGERRARRRSCHVCGRSADYSTRLPIMIFTVAIQLIIKLLNVCVRLARSSARTWQLVGGGVFRQN